MKLLQVTTVAGVATPIMPRNLAPANSFYVQDLFIQNNTGTAVRIGDATVSATRGIVIASGSPGGSILTPTSLTNNLDLYEWYLFCAAVVVVDILYQE